MTIAEKESSRAKAAHEEAYEEMLEAQKTWEQADEAGKPAARAALEEAVKKSLAAEKPREETNKNLWEEQKAKALKAQART